MKIINSSLRAGGIVVEEKGSPAITTMFEDSAFPSLVKVLLVSAAVLDHSPTPLQKETKTTTIVR
jgi:hypothetical protein